VDENLSLGAYARNDKAAVESDRQRIFSLFPRLKDRVKQKAGTLSGGEQQMLAVGRAMMTRPKLLMMDEPSLGLAPIVVKMIFNIIKEINAEGTTILLVEQNAKAALEAAHYGYVLETGRITLAGEGKKLLADDGVRKAYLGEDH
jgi:branched-chain amino acid transport system ATP-binding protein